MESSEVNNAKRKRSPSDVVPVRPMGAPTPPVNGTQINYLTKPASGHMKLVEGNPDTFSGILSLIDDYEGVLMRNESFAANLGAKLVGPLLLKSFDKLFDGPITVLSSSYAEATPISWLDVVEFARSKPQEFVLNNARVCQFWIQQSHVQVNEDDYRLILSGAPERMIPTQPIPEDEVSESGTIEILEQRLAMLIKKADMVAGRARQLNYHLKGRKAAINGRRTVLTQPEQMGATSSPFQTVNHAQNLTEPRNIHNDLLRQFSASDKRLVPNPVPVRMKPNRTSSETPHSFSSYGHHGLAHDAGRRASIHTSQDEDSGGPYRPVMTVRVEKLNRGDPIWPPCDRCRRLSIPCAKHLTACAGCTKKHAKCGWKDITPEEAAYLNHNPESETVGHRIQPPGSNVPREESAPFEPPPRDYHQQPGLVSQTIEERVVEQLRQQRDQGHNRAASSDSMPDQRPGSAAQVMNLSH